MNMLGEESIALKVAEERGLLEFCDEKTLSMKKHGFKRTTEK